ncbi:BglG family transcription antiterminator [Leuconostoc rapi]
MLQKERDLLLYLLDNQDRFVTSEELAETLSFSSRTIRSYVKKLKEKLIANGAQFESKPSFGYRLHIDHPVMFDLFLNENYELSQWAISTINKTDTIDRQKYILNKLVIENQTFLIDDLAERLFVTRSTLSKDLTLIRKILVPYRLVIDSKPNRGIFITGLERDRRHFILDYFFNHSGNTLQHYMANKSFFKTISFDQITIIVLDECREAGIDLTDFTIQNIVLYIALSVQRMAGGFELQPIILDDTAETKSVHAVAQNIIDRVETSSELNVPENEVAYLTIQLLAKGKNNNVPSDAKIWHDLDDILQKIEWETGYPVSQDYELRKNLVAHLKPMIVRLEQGLQLKNPLLQEIKMNYAPYFTAVKHYLSFSEQLSHFDINDDEIAYLTLHFMAAIEKYKDFNKPKALIICATGFGSAQLLNNRIAKEFGKFIHIVGIKGYYEIDDSVLQGVDFIISAIDLSTQVFKVPIVQVSIFLTTVDMQKLHHFLDQLEVNASVGYKNSSINEPSNEPLDYFDQFTNKTRFKIWQKPTTRLEVLDQLTRMIMTHELPEFKEDFLDQINQREQLSAVTFSDVIAVPHPLRPISQVPKIAIGVIPNGLKWSDDYPNIKLVFLLSPSYWNNQGLTETTQTIVRLTENIVSQEQLISAADFKTFRQQFMLMMKGGKN